MQLERLYIQGFKSFKDRTTIHFHEGVTGIVGPNGCGKSNIVDALFWVMGEQSAKHLRGKKMSDLIFSGSNKYSPASFAEVTLVLKNSNMKHIHIGSKVASPNEIQLTRKLYKNGETEYRINDIPARLKDIQEVFMDTGAGAKSYSIIAQGEIDRIVKAKPEDRRVMIEEVAGITKFKLRKKESLRKIEQTNQNLERIHDLKVEVHKQLKKLEGQAEKAEKARTLRDKVKRNELLVNSHRELEIVEKTAEYTRFVSESDVSIEQMSLEKATLEASIQDEKNQKTELIFQIDEIQSDYNEKAKKLVSLEEKLNALEQNLEHKDQFIEEKNNEIQQLEEDLEKRNDRIEEIKEDLERVSQMEESTSECDELESKIEEYKTQIQEEEAKFQQLKVEKEKLQEQVRECDNQIYKNNSQLEEQSRVLHEITKEIEELEEYFSQINDDSDIKKEKVKHLQKEIAHFEEKIDSLKDRKVEKNKSVTDNSQTKLTLSKKIIELQSQINSLEDVVFKAVEKEGSRDFVTERPNKGVLFQDLFEVSSEYSEAVERMLSILWDTVLTNVPADELLAWSESKNSNMAFFSMSEASHAEELAIPGVSLKELVKCKSKGFQNEIQKLLSQFYIVDNVSSDLIEQLSGTSTFIALSDKNGETILRNHNGHLLVEITKDSEACFSILEQKKNIETLKEELEEKSKELKSLEDILTQDESSLKKIVSELEELEEQRLDLKEEYISVKSSLPSEQSSTVFSTERLDKLQKRKKEISSLKLDLCEKEETFEDERVELGEALAESRNNYFESENKLTKWKSQLEESRNKFLELKSEENSKEFQLEQLQKQLKDHLEHIDVIKKRIEKAQNSIEDFDQSKEDLYALKDEHRENIANLSEEMKAQESQLSELKEELEQLSSRLESSEKSIQKLSQNITKLEKDTLEKKVKLEKLIEDEDILVRNMFDQHRVDLRAVVLEYLQLDFENVSVLKDLEDMYYAETEIGPQRVEVTEYEFTKRFPAQIKEAREKLKNYKTQLNRLGHINWQAVEDYDRQKVRYDFLRDQEEELKKSINDLLVAIDKIDEKSKERFTQAFEEVNEKFMKVFPIIFGGGSARLHLTGTMDTDEFGMEIIASPPGKKMQNINLMSGGEKAMTAVALIFSIFLVKPSPFCLLDEVDAPLDDANVGRFTQLLREMSTESQFIVITHNKKTMELNDTLYGITMQEPGVSKVVSVQLH
ncbi:MAG: chromosome segregation protein SMC [Halobacteriovoraceae bacterium]|nr:chromosome segregation protein SMC [Halobacteriovoraceae bacterium]